MTTTPNRRSVLKGIAGTAAVSGVTMVGIGGRASAETLTDPPESNSLPNAAAGAKRDDGRFDGKVAALVATMSVAEKLGQLQQLSLTGDTGPGGPQDDQANKLAAEGRLGSVLNGKSAARINALQKLAVEQSRLKIPILFGLDVIHGFLTTFPIPLGQASSFDPAVAAADARISATEARSAGIAWAFAPMMDVSREPRWGRVAEGNGEDPYLTSRFAVAKIQGLQGDDVAAADSLAACAKHFVAYGQPEGGRDYNTVDVSEQRLRNLYLEPFRAAVNAGVATVMASFNTISGVPGHANEHALTGILKGQWGFDGFVVSDWTGVRELVLHGAAADDADAARLAFHAGVDMEMVSTTLAEHGESLLSRGTITMKRLDDAVSRILRLKYRLGLFERPYADAGKEITAPTPAARAAARDVASRSMVLLKNDGVLPLRPSVRSIAVVGPFGDSTDLLGTWAGMAPNVNAFPATTVLAGIKAAAPGVTVTYARGGDAMDPDTSGVAAAVSVARAADVVVAVLGEPSSLSGEASARSDIGLPGAQSQLLAALVGAGKPIVVVLLNGRPLAIGNVTDAASALLEAWHPGIEGGNAIADILFGSVNPGGKLPVSFPRAVGSVPTYYNHENTGRPYDPGNPGNHDVSKYLDLPVGPLFPFGFGLSYSSFTIDGLSLSASRVSAEQIRGGAKVTVTCTVKNTSTRTGDEVVQLYVHDKVALIVQPVRRLRGFQRLTLAAGQAQTVTFELTAEDLGYWTNSYDGEFIVEPGQFEIYLGNHSNADLHQALQLT